MTDNEGTAQQHPVAAHHPGQRLDRWLFYARVVKSRTLAAKLIGASHVRVNGNKTDSPNCRIRPGDLLTIQLPRAIKVLRVVDGGSRRRSAPEAQALYEDLTPPPPPKGSPEDPGAGMRVERGHGRPSKRDRRQMDAVNRKARGESDA